MKVELNLFDDVPFDVGFSTKGNTVRRNFGKSDIPKIIECIEKNKARELRRMGAKAQPEELVKYDVTVYGYLTKNMIGKLTGVLKDNPEIKSFTYVDPRAEPDLIFPLVFE
jgi:hypothetical protein